MRDFRTERRTSADVVFDQLRADIVSLKLAPGAKLSEVEVAKRSAVSRQPVREAFIRLGDMGLLAVRPQKATLVQKISVRKIEDARFVRAALEVEVVKKACHAATAQDMSRISDNLKAQESAVANQNVEAFHKLDYAFHQLMCAAAGHEVAFQIIAKGKAHVDRLCMISLAQRSRILDLLGDHSRLFAALKDRDGPAMVRLTRMHLGRLDATIAAARQSHPHYFSE